MTLSGMETWRSKSAIRYLWIPKECASVPEALAVQGAFEKSLQELPSKGNANDLVIEERLDLALATVMSRGDDRALAAKIHDQFGLALPSTPRRVSNGVRALVGVGPGVWLAV